jgi:predicted acylesterase/phospholipase RssA
MANRAICLAGGGPAAGLHIGVLKGLQEGVTKNGVTSKVTFTDQSDVWALSCIGAWVGVIYNQADPDKEIDETTKFFLDVFRNDKSFKSFPANTVFTPDWAGNAEAMLEFLTEPQNYKNAFLPKEIMRSFRHAMSTMRRMSTPGWRRRGDDQNARYEAEFSEFSEGDFNRWTLNDVLAVNPAVRFLTALIYKSNITGLSRLFYEDSRFLKQIKFENLRHDEKPFIYYNAWNLTRQQLQLFANKPPEDPLRIETPIPIRGYKPMDAASLCACSALPFIEQTVKIGEDVYCEGALVDTVNLENLLTDHPDLTEIWISRIVDAKQVLPPRNLHDSLANLCELFCATVGEANIELFKCSLEKKHPDIWKKIKIIEIPVDCTINFEWSHSNLKHGINSGMAAAKRTLEYYLDHKDDPDIKVITPPEDPHKQRKRRELAAQRLVESGQTGD